MKVLLIVAFVLAAGVNSLPKATSPELIKGIPRQQLETQLRAIVAPGFKSALDDSVKSLLDTSVREIIRTGSESLGVPPLDPLEISHLELDIDQSDIQLKGNVDEVRVEKISSFVVESVKTNLLLLKADVAISVPEIVASGEYKADGVLGGLLPVYGEGRFSVSVQNVGLSVSVSLGSKDSYIYIKTLVLDVTIGGIKTNIEGLLGGGDLSDVLNEIISDLAPELFEEAKPTVLPAVADAIINLANEKLDGVTLSDLLDIISNGGL